MPGSTSPDLVRFAGADGDELTATLALPQGEASAVPAVVLVDPREETEENVRDATRRFTAAGFAVLAVDLAARADGAALADRRVNADLEGALEHLRGLEAIDAERLVAVGFGQGGTYAYLLGCCSRHLAAAVAFDAPLVYAELGPQRPAQPLEMALNLSVPLLAIYGGTDGVPPDEIARLQAVCSQFSRDCDIVVHPEVGPGFHDPREPAYDAERAEDAWRKTLEFLRERLEIEDHS